MADTLISRVISKIKENPVTITVVFLCAVLGGTASMFSSVETIWKTISSLISNDGKPRLVALQPPLSENQMQEQIHNLTDVTESEKKTIYAIVFLLTVKFSDDNFNVHSYLNSIDDLSISSKDKNLIHYEVSGIYPDRKIKKTDLKWWVSLAFDSKPLSSQQLNVSLGPVSWSIPVGSHDWKSYHYKDSVTNDVWKGAQAQLSLKIDNPDWTLIRSARLLLTPKRDMTLLEVVVENLSDRAMPLNILNIKASGPRLGSYSCNLGTGLPQILNLNLDVLASHSSKADPGAWTTINKVPVDVPTVYTRAGPCNGSSLVAKVPISNEAPPKGLSKVQVVIKGPSPLSIGIPTVVIGLNSEDDSPVYPREKMIPVFNDGK